MEHWRFSAAAILKEEDYKWSDSWTAMSDIGGVYQVNGEIFGITLRITQGKRS